jgi:hypothetical protein
MNGWFKRKEKQEAPHARYRIVQETYSDADRVQNRVTFSIEEWSTHYACDSPFWCGMYLNNRPNVFYTLESAQEYVRDMMRPIPQSVKTVVEEIY